jgi:hypothetical protein
MKSRRSEEDAGGFMIVESLTGAVLAGGSPHAFSMTLEEVKDYLAAGPKRTRMIPEIGAMAILKRHGADAMFAIERLLAGRSVRFNAAFPGPQLETKRLSALGEHAVSCRDGLNVSRGFNVLNTVVLAKFVEKPASIGHVRVLGIPEHDRSMTQGWAP